MCYSNASSIMKKKTIFLFLLFLMIYGAVNVDAQVRIGGGSAAHPSAVLDLNSGDATVATGGLLLPRVHLDSVGDTNVFGADVPLEQGLMVYNVNGDDATRPVTGVYYYNGEKWYFVSSESEYTGEPFTITAADLPLKSLWLGREGERTETLAVTLSPEPNNNRWTVKYTWTARSLDMSETVDLGSGDGNRMTFKYASNQKLTPGKVYAVLCEASVYDYRVESIAGYVVRGIGGWIGPHKWLNVANVNAGGDQTMHQELQLSTNIRSGYHKTIVGGLFQWGRAADGHEGADDGTLQYGVTPGPLSDESLDPETGTPIETGKFVTVAANENDWRIYPSGISKKPWYWRTMDNPSVGIDPCGMDKSYSFRPDGDWYVMTREQWNLLQTYNDLYYENTSRTRGISIRPAGFAKPESFFIMHSAWRPFDGILTTSAYDEPADMINLWLGGLSIDTETDKADVLTLHAENNIVKWSVSSVTRASGYHIRCVSE